MIINSDFEVNSPLAVMFKNRGEVRISSSCVPDLIFPSISISVTLLSLKNEALMIPEYARLHKISLLHLKVHDKKEVKKKEKRKKKKVKKKKDHEEGLGTPSRFKGGSLGRAKTDPCDRNPLEEAFPDDPVNLCRGADLGQGALVNAEKAVLPQGEK
jgi:hypothetical protein